jgi:hypothetical protein
MNKHDVIWILKRMKHSCDEDGVKAIDMAVAALVNQPEPERWRDAEWPRDAANPPKEARFRNGLKDDWDKNWLAGRTDCFWVDMFCRIWHQCQVRDE